MNKTSYLQGDGRWGGLVYPKKPCYIRNVGCGEVSIANILIEMEQYKNYTPATIQPYCKQYGAPGCEGTYVNGICKMMKHYGLTEVKPCDTMAELWKELEKGNRVAIYLMGSRPGGSKKVHWTSGGHFVASVDYKYENGKHYVYVKDPWTNDKNRNGWLTYEEHMKGDVLDVSVGKLTGAEARTDGKLVVDGIGGEETVKAMQKFFGTKQSGVIGGQLKKINKYYPSLVSVNYDKKGSGSPCIKKLQKWLGLTQDGVIGQGTTAAWQKKLRDLGYLAKNETIDGIFGVKSMKAWQKFLNDKVFTEKKEPEKKPANTTPTNNSNNTPKPPYKVIDVSDWQGEIDWAKVKADGVVGAIIRYADGTTLDKRFENNMAKAKYYGLHIGCYIFSRAKTKAQAEKEAERLYKAAKKYDPDMPYYIDLEVSSLSKYANTVAQAFIAKIKALGGKPGVYANLNWWNNYLKKTVELPFAMWLAQYNDKMDYKPASYVGMWQYTSSGKVNGISGKVDMNKCYVAYWESAPKPTEPTEPPKPKKTISELAQEVLDGKWGSGADRKKKITDAGYDYDAVQREVNRLVKARSIAQNALALCGSKDKPTEALKKASKEIYGDDKHLTYCHKFVGIVLGKSGYGKMPYSKWASILTYLKKNFEEIKINYTAEQLQLGDIRVRKNESGAYHIWIITQKGQKAEANSKKKYYPHTAKNNAVTKYTQDWLFRVPTEQLKEEEKTDSPKPQKTIDELAQEVIDGKWGNSDERKKRLTEAGYDYDAVQKRVNEIIESKKTVWQKICDWAIKIAKDDSYIYVHYKATDKKTRQCPICHDFPKGKYHGFYCTRFSISAWHHGGGIKIKCDKAPNNGKIERIYNAKTDAKALQLAREYFGIDDIKVIRNKNGIPQKQLQAGDACYYFQGSYCQHAFLYIGDGKMVDANSLKDGIAVRKAMSCKVAVRYVGK